MKAKLAFFGLVVASAVLAQQAQGPLTNQRIGDLVLAGVSQGEVIRIIGSASAVNFNLRPNSTDALLRVGVSEDIIEAMAAKESGAEVAPVATASVRAAPKQSEVTPVLVRAVSTPKVRRSPTVSSLSRVRRVYVEKLPNDFGQYLRAEFFKQMPKRVTIALDKAEADGILTGVDKHDLRIASVVTGRYFGLHDTTTASLSMLDGSENVVLWCLIAFSPGPGYFSGGKWHEPKALFFHQQSTPFGATGQFWATQI
jgi:hypothetical protein